MSRAGVVTALAVEARTLGAPGRRRDLARLPDGTLVAVSGMGAEAAAAGARRLLEAGADALVSWGLAGGLDPALAPGTVCLPAQILDHHGQRFDTDRHWRESVGAALAAPLRVAGGALLSSACAIDAVAGKAAAFRATAAVAVDMESAAIAAVAAERQVPFIAVRVIVDGALDALPAAVAAAAGTDDVHMLRLLLGVARSPGDIVALFGLARRFRSARRALIGVARTGALAPLAFGTAGASRIA